MRAIDYLLTRPEVNGSKIGCMGHSGGGTLTMFISALDDRVGCAVINEGGTGNRWPLATRVRHRIEPSDVEQNLFPAALYRTRPNAISMSRLHPDRCWQPSRTIRRTLSVPPRTSGAAMNNLGCPRPLCDRGGKRPATPLPPSSALPPQTGLAARFTGWPDPRPSPSTRSKRQRPPLHPERIHSIRQ